MLDRYSWEQISLMATCVLRDRFATIESLLEPMVTAMGAEDYVPPQVGDGKRRRRPRRSSSPHHRVHRSADYDSPEAKDNALLSALGRAGIRVRNVEASGGNGETG
jgi:hypothetical protein